MKAKKKLIKKEEYSDEELPDQLLGIPNPDKAKHEKWYEGRNMLNFPCPSRICLAGGVGAGKTNTVKNIIMRAKPAYTKLIVIHCSMDTTHEYDDMGDDTVLTMLSSIPDPTELIEMIGKHKCMVILEDLEYKSMKSIQRKNLDRLFGYVSTHGGQGRGVSVCINQQDIFNIPPVVRKLSSVYILWRMVDTDALKNFARKCGIEPAIFISEMKKLQGRDSLWIDMTPNTPYKLRKNGFDVINPYHE